MTLRAASLDDCLILSDLHSACFPRGWGVTEFASFFERDNIIAVIAEQDEKPVGFVFCWVVAGECELLALGVVESARRQGIAKRLLHDATNHMQALGAQKVHLEVNVHNKAAQALYLAEGYEIVARRKGYYRQADGTRADAVTMVLRLS